VVTTVITKNKRTSPLALLITLFLVSFGARSVVAQEYATKMVVSKDGTGDFTSIQAAINASKTYPWHDISIFVKNGVYAEKVEVYSWNTRIKLIGESKENTIITYGDHFNKINLGRNSTFHTYTLMVRGNDFSAQNLTIINSAGAVGQAVALHIEADRVSINNVAIKGHQDSLYLAGEGFRSYFKDCYIEGTTDFIFGEGTAMFEDCEVKSLSNSYITAASTPKNQAFGFVFNRVKLTASAAVDKVYLGRPWRHHAKTVFINSDLGLHIAPEGWQNWGDVSKQETVFYAEFNNSGQGTNSIKRVAWAHQLSQVEAQNYTIKNVMRGWQPNIVSKK
jgi:pectinesterase